MEMLHLPIAKCAIDLSHGICLSVMEGKELLRTQSLYLARMDT